MVVEAPLAVKIVVYDLVRVLHPARRSPRVLIPSPFSQLPPSRLAAFLNLLGSGVYHSSVSIAIPLGPTDSNPTPKEYAFGGHYQPGVSGIFAVPEGTAASRMPGALTRTTVVPPTGGRFRQDDVLTLHACAGLKYYLTLDVGEAFGEDWRRVFGPKLRRRSLSRVNSVERSESSTSPDRVVNARGTGGEQGPVPYGGGWTPTASTTRLTVGDGATDAGEDPFKDPEPVDEDARLEDDGGEKDGTQYMTKLQRRAWRIIEQMKKEEEWNGTKYSLLSRSVHPGLCSKGLLADFCIYFHLLQQLQHLHG